MSDRKAYNKMQTQARRNSSNMLQNYAEMFPEKFAELQERAKREINEPPLPRQVTTTHLPPLNINDIHTASHYFIYTKDAFGNKHTLFESGINPEAAIAKGQERWPQYVHEIVSTESCTCPLCV